MGLVLTLVIYCLRCNVVSWLWACLVVEFRFGIFWLC